MKASILVYSLLASFFYFPTLLFAETSTFNRLFGVDLFGNDLTAMGIKGLGLAECEAICSNDEACKAYSFIEAKRWCFPKYDVGDQTENFSIISGVKTLPACSPSGRLHKCFGTWSHESGYTYTGEWLNNKQHGQGTATWALGDKYFGEFENGQQNGQGTHIFADGSKYVGSFVDGSGTGKGSYTYGPNSEWAGDKYVGDHDNWVRSGIGTYIFANGAVLEGIWKDGEYQYHREIVNALEPSLVEKCSTDPKECTPKKLCEFATDQDGSNTVWSDASNKVKHVRFAQSSGMNCGVITIVDPCDTDPNDCKINQLCEKATTDNGGQTFWNRAAHDYVEVAKKYGMTCGVPAKTIIREFNPLETEANNNPSDADDIVSGKAITGQLHSSSDKDYFAIVAEGAGTISVNFETSYNSGNAYYTVSLVDSDGNVLASQKTGQDTKFSAGISNAATYYAIVSGATYYTGKEYKLTAQTTVTNMKGAETEANNNPSDADDIVSGKAITGQLHSSSDKDYFAIVAEGAGTISVNFETSYNSGNAYYTVSLVDSDGNVLASQKTGQDTKFSAGISNAATYYAIVSAATYYTGEEYKITAQTTVTNTIGAETEANNNLSDAGLPNCVGNYDLETWSGCLGQRAYSNGGRYAGEFTAGLRHGRGTHTYSNGSKYVGNWEDDKRAGQGTFEMKTALVNIVQDGLWKNDVFQGENKMETPAQNELGQILCVGSPHEMSQMPDVSKNWNACLGEIRWEYSGGGSYVGEFENGAWHGQGTFKQGPTEEYVGEWQNNQPHGQGTYTYADGTINTGQWENGVFQN
ncbi:hypothetical protein N9I60_02285 [Planktomarina temperata]|nr:hypothetical protein [Planktomarina temperata]